MIISNLALALSTIVSIVIKKFHQLLLLIILCSGNKKLKPVPNNKNIKKLLKYSEY